MPEPGNPQSLNRYTYVYNNPIMYSDPTGHVYAQGAGGGVGGKIGPPAPNTPLPSPVPPPPAATPSPDSIRAPGSVDWLAELQSLVPPPDTAWEIVEFGDRLHQYYHGFDDTKSGVRIYRKLCKDGKIRWIAAGKRSDLAKVGLYDGVAVNAEALSELRAAGRTGDWVLWPVGWAFSVVWNLSGHAVHGSWGTDAMKADLIVDTGGWAASDVPAAIIGTIAIGVAGRAGCALS